MAKFHTSIKSGNMYQITSMIRKNFESANNLVDWLKQVLFEVCLSEAWSAHCYPEQAWMEYKESNIHILATNKSNEGNKGGFLVVAEPLILVFLLETLTPSCLQILTFPLYNPAALLCKLGL